MDLIHNFIVFAQIIFHSSIKSTMKINVFERQVLAIGLTLAGHPVKGDKARMTKLNARRFKSKYGSSPAVLVKICSLTYCFDTILGSACVCACFQRTQKCPPNFLCVEKNLKK